MEKYARVLVIIFFLILTNLGLSFYILNKLDKPVAESVSVVLQPTRNPSPVTTVTTPPTIQNDLNSIKAEIRALRDSLETTGIITQTPTP